MSSALFVLSMSLAVLANGKISVQKKTEFDVKLRKKVKKTGKLSGVCQNDQNKGRQSKQKKFKCQDFDLILKLNNL